MRIDYKLVKEVIITLDADEAKKLKVLVGSVIKDGPNMELAQASGPNSIQIGTKSMCSELYRELSNVLGNF